MEYDGRCGLNDHDVIVVEAYLDATKKEAFLFGYEDGEPPGASCDKCDA